MIVSVQIAELGVRGGLGVLARPPRAADVPGLRHAETVFTAPISDRVLPAPNLATVGLIAAWEDDDAFERFTTSHPLAQRLAGGWQVRLQPLRVSGAWTEVPDLLERQQPVEDEEPVVVLTIGRTKPWRLPPFLRAAAAAEADAVAAPGLLASTGFGRLPRLVSTFSVWRSAAEMRDYAYREAGAHRAAVAADKAHPFHFSSAFIRFRPIASSGSWNGRNPLALAEPVVPSRRNT
jgi:heme-degrading monooxygenase HmoA